MINVPAVIPTSSSGAVNPFRFGLLLRGVRSEKIDIIAMSPGFAYFINLARLHVCSIEK